MGFQLFISTKPNVVKYATSGSVTLTGKADDIKKKLEVNPKTKIPQILFTIYQHVFNSIYMLSSNLNTPYPPPDLLHPMAEKIQILSSTTGQGSTEKTEAAPAATPAPAATAPNAASQAPAAAAQPQPAATTQPAPTATPAATPEQPASSPAPAPAATPAQPEAEKKP